MSETVTPPAGLFPDGTNVVPFTPMENEKHAGPRGMLREFAVVRPDGYLEYIGSAPGLGSKIAQSLELGDPRVFVSRYRGDSQWWMLAPENSIPDTLPDDFA